MSTRTAILALSLALLVQGCAQLQLDVADSALHRGETIQQSAESLTVESEVMAVVPAAQDKEQLAPTPINPGSAIDSTATPKADPQEAKGKTGSVQNHSWPSRNDSGPRAEDRFLNSLERDLNNAMKQPVERRRLEFSKAVIENQRVRYFINQFSKSGKNDLERALARSGKYMPMIVQVLHDEGVPEELAYLALIESGFQTHSASPSGAVGIWQFMAGTARQYGLRIDSWV
ncbi:MAG TPA: transglycosylase SLT domain-containing protein, partial [Candidatus Binatia bacterium]|nr:transglycosylase SLT domain-containing protein [Candidatus Binatia bacterium]